MSGNNRAERRRVEKFLANGGEVENLPVQIPAEMLYRLAFEEHGTEAYRSLQEQGDETMAAIQAGAERFRRAAAAREN